MTETPLLTEGRRASGVPRTTLTTEVIDRLMEAIGRGMYVERACALVGVHKSTFYQWRQRGTAEPDSIFSDLNDAVEKAEADDQARRLSRMEAAAEGGAVITRDTKTKTLKDGSTVESVKETTSAPAWQADAWSLERRYRKEYSQPRGDAGIVSGGTALLLFARIEFVGVDGGEELDVMEVAEIGPGEGK